MRDRRATRLIRMVPRGGAMGEAIVQRRFDLIPFISGQARLRIDHDAPGRAVAARDPCQSRSRPPAVPAVQLHAQDAKAATALSMRLLKHFRPEKRMEYAVSTS
jgi:hypothetical protein